MWKEFEANRIAWYTRSLLMTGVGQYDCLSVTDAMLKESFMVNPHVRKFHSAFLTEGRLKSLKNLIFGYGEIHLGAYSSLCLKTHTLQYAALFVIRAEGIWPTERHACECLTIMKVWIVAIFDTEQGFPWESCST